MKVLNKVYLVDDQFEIVEKGLKRVLPSSLYCVESFKFDPGKKMELQLDRCLEAISRDIDIDVVLLDVKFGSGSDAPPLGLGFLSRLWGMGVPVILMSQTQDVSEIGHYANFAGRFDASWVPKTFTPEANTRLLFELKRFHREMVLNAPFNRENLPSEERYSASYDKAELSSMGTLFAIRWENKIVLDTIRSRIAELRRRDEKRGIRILDVGCGTGRFAELVLRNPAIDKDVESFVGVDYSPGMLAAGRRRMQALAFHSNKLMVSRRIAERLFHQEEKCPPFDIVIMGFGVPSFVKGPAAFSEIYRILAPGGRAVFTGYNDLQQAANHRFRRLLKDQTATDLCAVIEKRGSRWMMGPDPYWIDFHAFGKDDFYYLLGSVGFAVDDKVNRWQTFPTLVSCMRKKLLGKQNPTLPAPDPTAISYLETDPLRIGFNKELYQADVDFSRLFPDAGYYFNVVVRKDSR